jgi:hypothetical protein
LANFDFLDFLTQPANKPNPKLKKQPKNKEQNFPQKAPEKFSLQLRKT